jgi:hypothetical protein
MKSIFLLIAYALPAFAQPLPDAHTPNLPNGFLPPDVSWRYTRVGEPHDYGKPELGVAYQYRPAAAPFDSSFATLYLYQREVDERTLPPYAVLTMNADGFKLQLETMRGRGDYNEYSIMGEGRDSVKTQSGAMIPGYHVSYTYRRGETNAVSYFYLFVAGNTLLKVRASAPIGHIKDPELALLAKSLVAESAKDYRP